MTEQVIEPKGVNQDPGLTLATLSQVCGRVLLAVAVSCVSELLLCQSNYGYLGWAILCLTLACIGVGNTAWRGSGNSASMVWRAILIVLFAMGVGGLVWQGNALSVAGQFTLIVALVLNEHGIRPTALPLLRTLQLSVLTLGKQFLYPRNEERNHGMQQPSSSWHQANAWSYLIPAIVAAAFMFIFILANEEAVSWFAFRMKQFGEWLLHLGPFQFITWLFVAAVTLTVLSPWLKEHAIVKFKQQLEIQSVASQSYLTALNTLVVVIVVFSGYLLIEFTSTWLREFPEGFHYSGYAHQGAAWLVVALFLSTVVLSAIFSGERIHDPRYRNLLVLANTWSMLNLLLSIAAMWRMLIYIDFNGLTVARIVGIAGILCVVTGFALLMWKINQRFTFIWLIDKQLVALFVFCFLLVVLPIDWMAQEYNVRQIESGNERPTVQLVCQEISDEAMLPIIRLKDHPTAWIRKGALGLLQARSRELRAADVAMEDQGTVRWPNWQGSTDRLSNSLSKIEGLLEKAQEADVDSFKESAYRWY